jgi:hypothetical protein
MDERDAEPGGGDGHGPESGAETDPTPEHDPAREGRIETRAIHAGQNPTPRPAR